MIQYDTLIEGLNHGAYTSRLAVFYAEDTPRQEKRLIQTAQLFSDFFGHTKGGFELFSAPGRSEICGNHTDHNRGKVMAAAINLDAVAVAKKRDDLRITVKSAGHEPDDIYVSDLTPSEMETGRSAAMIRGVCAGFVERGCHIGGFEAATMSDVLGGSGLSSSAAFEVLIGTILNHFYNDGQVPPLVIAQIAQYAENRFFGKPSGLMDQTACSVGGFVRIDFGDAARPVVEKVDFDFDTCGHALCVVDSGGSHANLTEDYGLVRGEMEAAARALGKSVLRELSLKAVLAEIPGLRETLGDRAVLRALHFFAENERVDRMAAALARGDFEAFKSIILESGRSSFMYNQNVYTGKPPQEQPVSLALALSETALGGRGAWRVHGGGFAGTIQAFVPLDMLEGYRGAMEAVFGPGSCYVLRVRAQGGSKLLD
ncbi:MAG: galactokinase [Oscillospiraceae bacterium]|nr:galactokinase [Oscillospiraceae bacterium]